MSEKPEKARLRLELTERQKQQIRRATGRDVKSLELRLQRLPEPADGQAGVNETDDTNAFDCPS